MRRQLLDVEDHQAVLREDALRHHEREVAEVLVIDGVELVLRHQPREMRKLHRDDTAGGQQAFHAADEIVEIRHVRQHVISQQQVRKAVFARDGFRGCGAEETYGRRNPLLDRDLRDVCSRLDPEYRNAPRDEVLQQVAVVARDLHYPAVRTEPKPIAHLVDVAARVFDPARRIRREVCVVGEDLVRRDEFLQLHQETRITHIRMQRIERLHLVQLVGRDVRLAQGRHPEIDEGRG